MITAPRAAAAALLLLCAGAPRAVHAQTGVDLDRVEQLIDAGSYAAARAALARWQEAARTAEPAERRTAALLEARLERDGVAAQHAYLALALADPFAAQSAAALLHVGQAALLQGDTASAQTYLRRFVDDFPTHARRAEGFLWLSRTAAATGDRASACRLARDGLAAGAASEVRPLLNRHQQGVCGTAPLGAAAGPADRSGGRFAVQLGAFRAETSARALADRARAAGLDARVVTVPGSALLRVRAGHLASSSAAVDLRNRAHERGFEAVVVSDAAAERPAP